MGISNALLAYNDCIEVFDAAIASERGVRVRLGTFDRANFFRMRLHKARTLTREANKKIYDFDNPLYGASPYDPYVVRIRNHDNVFYVYLEPNLIEIDAIEYIGGDDPLAQPILEPPAPEPDPTPDPTPALSWNIRRI